MRDAAYRLEKNATLCSHSRIRGNGNTRRIQRRRPGTADSVAASMAGPVRTLERPSSTSQLVVAPNNSTFPVENLSQLLSGRFAGVQVLSGGATGTGSRIRIRGQSSILLGNEPLIVVDGVRLIQTHNPATQLPSLVDDINVDEIERVEILNGPSGTTLYGNEGAHGVINIITKRGVAGKLKLNAYTEQGLIDDPHTYPNAWARWGKRPGAAVSSPCIYTSASAGPCVTDSVSRGNVMSVDSLTPMDWGYRSQ